MGTSGVDSRSLFGDNYLGNSLVKSTGLYVGQTNDGLVGGGLVLAGNRSNGY